MELESSARAANVFPLRDVNAFDSQEMIQQINNGLHAELKSRRQLCCFRQSFFDCGPPIFDCHARAQRMQLRQHGVVRFFQSEESSEPVQFVVRNSSFAPSLLEIKVTHKLLKFRRRHYLNYSQT